MTDAKSEPTFRDIINGLTSADFNAPPRLAPRAFDTAPRELVSNESGSLVAVDSEDEAESRARQIAGMMAYTGSLAFFAGKTPTKVLEGLATEESSQADQRGVKETLIDGTTLHHLNRNHLRTSMKCIVKVHLERATDVSDRDGFFNFFSPKSDPFVVFKHGMSMAKSNTIKNNASPEWHQDYYLFIRRNRIHKQADDKLEISLFGEDPHVFFWQRNHSLKTLGRIDDLLGSKQIDLDLSKADNTVKNHTIVLDRSDRNSKKQTTLYFSTQVLTVDEFCADVKKSENCCWLDDYVIKQKKSEKTDWLKLLDKAKISYTPMYPYIYFDVHSSGTQAWIFGNIERKVLVVAFMATDPSELSDYLTDFNTSPDVLKEITEDRLTLKPKLEVDNSNIEAHMGFRIAYASIREILMESILSISDWSNDWLVVATGHSLGGSLCTLTSFEIANRERQDGEAPEVAMFSFGAPSVGNDAFYEQYAKSVPIGFRVVYYHDAVASAMFPSFNRLGKAIPNNGSGYTHINEIMNATCNSKGDQRYANNEAGASRKWYQTIRGFSALELVQHDEGSYFEVASNFLHALFPAMKNERDDSRSLSLKDGSVSEL